MAFFLLIAAANLFGFGSLGTVFAQQQTSVDSTVTKQATSSAPEVSSFAPQATLTVASDSSPRDSLESILSKRGSISFRKTPLSEVVFLLSDLWKINIVAGESVGGEVSGVFYDAPLRDILTSVLTASGHGYRQLGDSLVVLPLDQVRESLSDMSVRSESTGSIGQPSQAFGSIAYFTLQYTEAEQLAAPLKDALGASTVVAAYPEENRLMVKGTPTELQIASEAIQQLDVPRQQVRITALIYDVGLDELERLGVRWFRNIRVPDAEGAAAGASQMFSATATLDALHPDGATSLALRSISNNFDAALLIEALDQTAEAKLLANPSITVSDRREASIRIVKRLPIIAAQPVAGSNAVFTQVEFEEAGVILNVTPRISRDGTIEMNVRPEFSVKVGETNGNPIIDSRTAETTVRVLNGHTFALGGLRQKSITETVQGVPWLKDVKYFGALFRNHRSNVIESELIVFLKPELVEPCHMGTARERRAVCVATTELDAIPYASHMPQTPYCRDPNCPVHAPRPRINGGSRELEMLGGDGLSGWAAEGMPAAHEPRTPYLESVEIESPINSDQALQPVRVEIRTAR